MSQACHHAAATRSQDPRYEPTAVMAASAILNVSFRASLLCLVPACTQDNPGFLLFDETTSDPVVSTTTTTPGATTPSGGAPTSDDGGSEAASSGSTDPIAQTTGDPGGDSSESGSTLETTETSTSGSSSETSAGPGSLELPATIATCALLPAFPSPHAGPQACELIASSQVGEASGGMILDTKVIYNGGANRPGHLFFRFDIPPSVADLQLSAVRLEAQVDDNQEAGGPSAGTLYRGDPFDLLSLEFAAPGYGDPGGASADVPLPSGIVSWSFAPEWLVPGAALYLRIVPDADDGVVLYSNAAAGELRPRLHIDYL